MKRNIQKVCIANRGEIAIRIHHTLKQMGISTLGIYSEEDTNSYHRFVIDHCESLGDGNIQETYLNIEKILSIAKQHNCDAIHPGYGFLSENYIFAQRCQEENLTWIGPPASIIQKMGDKILSKKIAQKANVPTLKSITGNPEEIANYIQSHSIQFPIIVKASAGGGGKGMKILSDTKNIYQQLQSSSREAKNYFGNETIFVEEYIKKPRHIEVQILADSYGNIIHLLERECSIQRRYQKIIEEAPSPTLTEEERNLLYDYAIRIAKEIDYQNAGTIEFLYDSDQKQFYFLEMNTRIQVEHPVTEMITGIDIVAEQIQLAQGNALSISQTQIFRKGHAIEVRIYAEDPENYFLPDPGTIITYIEPKIPFIRIDSALQFPQNISSHYDPMISKVISWGENRKQAMKRLIYALKNYIIHGIKTNLNYLIDILESPQFQENQISTHFCEESDFLTSQENHKEYILATALFSQIREYNNKKNLSFEKSSLNSIWNAIGKWRNV